MYECGPSDRHELELIQGDILERLQYLREKGYSLKEDLTTSGGLLGQNLSFKFDNECFTTEIGLRRSYYLDREIKPNDTFMITFIFKTLGTFATGRNISN